MGRNKKVQPVDEKIKEVQPWNEKYRLLCTYGGEEPNSIIPIEKEEAEKLLAIGWIENV